MARSTFKTLFYINRSKEKKNGKCPIMGRITIDGKQVQYSTGKEIAPELWDSRKGRCKGTGEEIKEINRYLQAKEEQAKAKYQELVWQRGYITAELLKCELIEEDKPKGFLLEEAHLFIEDKRPCVGVTIAKPTFANYIYATQLIEAYLRERLGLEDIRYSLLDYGFIEGMDFYLKSERNLSLATIQVVVIFLRKLIGIGQQKKYIRIDPFADYKAELPHRTRRYLTTEELQRVLQTPIIDKQFERARQLFIFCAFTGLARVDMQRLKPKHITHNADGTEEIRIKRQKTNVEAIIPLLPIAKQILSLYIKDKKADDLIFPNLTIRKASFACVNIGQICRIDKGLTFHMARHTFASVITLSAGVPIETVSGMLGHTNLRTTQVYAAVNSERIRQDMQKIQQRIEHTFTLKL